MTTSNPNPETEERIKLDRLLATINDDLFSFFNGPSDLLETIIHEPLILLWLAGALNKTTKTHKNYYFYNQDNLCLDYYSLIDPPATDGSNKESEIRNGRVKV